MISIRWIAIGVMIATASLWSSPLAADHPLHSSRANIDFNAETCSFEVSLFVFPDDLQQGLEKFAGREVSLSEDPAIDELLQQYIGKEFELRLGDQPPQPLEWIGHEWKPQEAWLYFEFPVDVESPTDLRLKNTLFMNLFDDQLNVAYVRIGGRQRCVTHRTDTPSWQNWTVTRKLASQPAESKSTESATSAIQ